MSRNKYQKIIIVLTAVLLLPLWMWLAWLLTSKKKLVAVIVDKTVEMTNGSQHASFTWVLNNQRFTKNANNLYNSNHDYFGFFPLPDEKFRLKGLERFSPELLEKLSNDADMVYFTDTYGVYKNDWYKKKTEGGSGIIYGGMSEQDIELLQKMKAKHKLIISEFNTIGSPTSDKVRGDFEDLFGLKWSGWVGRYFPSLDTTGNADLPAWIVNNYKDNYKEGWPFHAAGIVFVNTNGKVVILEKGNQLSEALPSIHVEPNAQKKYNLPEQIAYPFWFDVMQFDSSLNEPIAEFEVKATGAGMQLLKQNNIPVRFPAILMHKNKDYQFYYFSGNFCDNPVSMKTSYFKGISAFESLFYHSEDATDRKQFFWKFYRPLITVITNDYYELLERTNAGNISGK